MPFPLYHFGQTTIAKVQNSDELRRILVDPSFESETIIIKPNWVTNESADFTDTKTLRMIFEVLDSNLVVTESYSIARSLNLLREGMSFVVEGREVNWKWLLKGDGWNWLVNNPDWDWFKRGGHWNQIKKEDQAFRDKNGFTDLFSEFDVTYINVTNEIWSEKIANPARVKTIVEERFKPVNIDRLYSMVPKKLYDLRGSTFVSLAKLKAYASFTIKNIFGMIPDPLKPWWHGQKNSRIGLSIIDINKIYHSLFKVYGIVEALSATAVPDPEGMFEGTYRGKYNILEGSHVVAFGRNLVSLDALLLGLTDCWILVADDIYRMPIDMAEEVFGTYDRELIKEAKIQVGNWINF